MVAGTMRKPEIERVGMKFETVQGDIAAQSADALVNAAGTSLRMGSGVAGALRRQREGEGPPSSVCLHKTAGGRVLIADREL